MPNITDFYHVYKCLHVSQENGFYDIEYENRQNQLSDATKINIFPECLQNYWLLSLLLHLFLMWGGKKTHKIKDIAENIYLPTK